MQVTELSKFEMKEYRFIEFLLQKGHGDSAKGRAKTWLDAAKGKENLLTKRRAALAQLGMHI